MILCENSAWRKSEFHLLDSSSVNSEILKWGSWNIEEDKGDGIEEVRVGILGSDQTFVLVPLLI